MAELGDGRIVLRPLQAEDAPTVYASISESRAVVGRWMGWCHPEFSLAETEQWIAHCGDCWRDGSDREFGIFAAGSGRHLGGAGLNQFNRVQNFANLGYWVRTDRSAQGVATAAARLLARYGFGELGLTRIEIVVQVDNAASRRVAEKLGCRCEGVLRNRILFRGTPLDAAMYSLVPADLA